MGASDGMRPKALTAKTSPASPTSEPPIVQTGLAKARMKMSLTFPMIPLLPGHRHRPLAPTEGSETDGKRRHGGIGRAEPRWASAHPHARSRPQPPVPAYARMGQRDKALELLHHLEEIAMRQYVAPHHFATIYTGLGDLDQAFRWWTKARDENAFDFLIYLRAWPGVNDALRSDPRYAQLLRSMSVPH